MASSASLNLLDSGVPLRLTLKEHTPFSQLRGKAMYLSHRTPQRESSLIKIAVLISAAVLAWWLSHSMTVSPRLSIPAEITGIPAISRSSLVNCSSCHTPDPVSPRVIELGTALDTLPRTLPQGHLVF